MAFSHLGKHEEVGKGGNGKADSDAQNKEADKIGAAGCLLEQKKSKFLQNIFSNSNLICECADCSDNASTSGARNTKSHYAGEHELTTRGKTNVIFVTAS